MLQQLNASAARVRGSASPEVVARGFRTDSEIFLGVGALAPAMNAASAIVCKKLIPPTRFQKDSGMLQDLDAVLDLSDADIAQVERRKTIRRLTSFRRLSSRRRSAPLWTPPA